jgi:EmrB/QacA subfamily drug resistance transporter
MAFDNAKVRGVSSKPIARLLATTTKAGEMQTAGSSDAGAPESSTRRWWTLIAVCAATFMLLVDVTIVQVALPTIERHFSASFTDLQWVIDAYALTLATLILSWGSISDRIGRKRVFLAGLGVFTASSLLCGFATSITMLIWSRALQGVGGAAMFATGLALIGQDFHGRERAKAIAAWGATVGGAVAIGPLVGGVLTSGLGWRWIFIVNAPIGVFAIWLSATRMVNRRDPGATGLDVMGLVTFSATMLLLEFGLIRGNSLGWHSRTILSLFTGAAIAVICFVVVEIRQSRPMFDLALFRKPGFTGVCIGTFAIGAGMFALLPYLTLYLQNDLGFSALSGGLRLLPATVLTFLVPLAIRGVAERLPANLVFGGGLAITAGGLAALLFVNSTSSWVALIPGEILTGIGIGIANPSIARIGLGVVPPERSGMASGISNTFRIGGLATGVAALGAIFQQRISASLSATFGAKADQVGRLLSSSGVRATVSATHGGPGAAATLQVAFVAGLRVILVIGLVLVALGAIFAVTLVRAKDFVRAPGAQGARTAETAAAFDA